MKKITFLTSLLLIFSLAVLYAQEEGGSQGAQAPWFFYWPQEDPDNFSLSTMGTTNVEPTQAGSTLGAGTTQRRSNIDVNQPRERPQETETDTSAVDEYIAEVESAQQGSSGIQSGGSNMYKWVDANGEVHVTNNPGSIPPEYRDQVTIQ